jgi:hypothetical protein
MAKKIWYSSPLGFYWDELYGTQRKLTPYITDEKIFALLKHNIVNSPLSEAESPEERDLVLVGLQLWREDLDKELLHVFFLEKRLRDFLEGVPLSDLDGIKRYLYANGRNKRILFYKTRTQRDCVVYSYGLHIPYEKDGYAFTFNIYEDNNLEMFFSRGNQNGGLSDRSYSELLRKKDDKSIVLAKFFRLGVNTIAYMKCFPDCVVEGVPRITVDRNESRSDRNITLSVSERISEMEKVGKSKIPHFRRGYFKLLKSDYYTHKQGELIFVHETVVNGKAKTVYTSNNIDQIESLNGD